MAEKIRRMNSSQVEKVLSRYGFKFVSQRGSHRKWRNLERRLQVIVPRHTGRDLPLGTIRAIFVNAEIPETEWKVIE